MTPPGAGAPDPEAAGPASGTGRLRTPSLHLRVTVVLVALLAGLLLVLGLTVNAVLTNRLQAQLRDRLLDRASFAPVVAEQISSPQQRADRLEGDGVSVRVVTSDGDVYVAGRLPRSAVDGSGDGSDDGSGSGTGTGSGATSGASPSVRSGPPGPGGGPAPAPAPSPGEKADAAVVDQGSFLSVSERLEDGTTVQLFADRASVDDAVSQVRFALLIGSLVVLLLAALALVPVVRAALRPLVRITDVARGISGGDRGRRLHPDRPGTELGRLGVAFDDMLDAVEGAEAQARASEQRLRDFVSDAAHELRTPVTGIRATSEHLLRDDPGREQRERLLLTLVRESDRAGRLVEDLLLMARIDRGLELRTGPVDVRALVDHCVAARRTAHPEARFAVEVPGGLTVTGDEQRLTQVLGNLLDNAVQAAGPAGSITVVARPAGDRVEVDVADDGPGVPPADRERIFERLTRLDAARERRRGGAGLGLPIARGIARAHGGDLRYVDASGRTPGGVVPHVPHADAGVSRAKGVGLPHPGGACFRITLPGPVAGAAGDPAAGDAADGSAAVPVGYQGA